MKYAIGYSLNGEAKKYHQKLVKELATKFKEPYLIENPIHPHVTLKYPFRTRKIKQIEKILEEFSKNHKSAKIKIRKINNFHKKVVFLQVDFSNEANKIYLDLKKELKKVDWLEWSEFDSLIGNFHSTLVYGNNPKSFKEIWKYVSKIHPKFDLKLNQIVIIKKPKKYWEIHKIYKLK
jgi:hypothetical protein